MANPIGNPDYPGYTATGGANWVDYDTVQYNNSLTFTYNFAYGGAVIDRDLVTPYATDVVTFEEQVTIFLDNLSDKPGTTPWTSEDSLFSVWIGINDIGNTYYLSGDRAAFSDTLLDRYFELIQSLVSQDFFLPNDANILPFLIVVRSGPQEQYSTLRILVLTWS